jgi:hypothetical protein
MKNELIRAALAMTALGAVLLSLSCQGGGGNNTANANRAMVTNTNASQSTADAACTGTPEEKINKIKKAIDTDIENDPELRAQKNFSISVSEENKIISIKIAGKVAAKEVTFSQFVGIFHKYIKKDCVRSVKFESTTATAASFDFQWNSCDDPKKPCPNGECSTDCPQGMMQPANSNSNTNSNTSSDSNSKKGNTNKP